MLFLAGLLLGIAVGSPLLLITAGLPCLVWACVERGPRRVFAILGALDLLILFPLIWIILDQLSRNSIYRAEPPYGWSMPAYLLCAGLGAVLLSRCRIPDGLLPMRGLWARKMLALIAVGGLLILPLTVSSEILGLSFHASNAAPGFVLLTTDTVYLSAFWDVLVRGWTPEEPPTPAPP